MVISHLLGSTVFAQRTEKNADLLAGKWSGKIQSEMRAFGTKGELIARGKSSLEIINISVQLQEKIDAASEKTFSEMFKGSVLTAPIQNSFAGWAIFNGLTEYFDSKGKLSERWSLPNNEETIKVDGHFLKDNTLFIASDTEILMKQEQFLLTPFGYTVYEHPDWPAFSMGGSPLFPTRTIKFNFKKGKITIDDIWKEGGGEIKVTGELYRVELLKKIFPKDIKPNEPIKTDKRTQLEITMPSKDVIKVAQNTEAVIRSESLMKVMNGKIHGLIKKLKPKTKFEVHSPTSVTSIRGTEFMLNVSNNITTTVIVLDGEVEFLSKDSQKTVKVRKNQQSVLRPQQHPSDPISIKPKRIPKWWE